VGAGLLGQNDVTWGEANSSGVPPDQIRKQSRVMNLSLHKHWLHCISLSRSCLLIEIIICWLTKCQVDEMFWRQKWKDL
jgi:hypothetical protein